MHVQADDDTLRTRRRRGGSYCRAAACGDRDTHGANQAHPATEVRCAEFEFRDGIAELAPSVNIGRHTHPGLESGYVMDGEFTLLVEGKPPLALKAGDSYQ